MAKRRSLDMKALMLAHVEKVVCVVIALCFVLLLWSAVSTEGIPAGIEPADIQVVASRAKSNVTRTTWDDFSSKPQMRNFAQESGWYTIPFDPYKITTAWNPPNFHTQGLRDDPKYFGVAELEAHYDQGPLVLLTGETLQNKFGRESKIPAEVEKLIIKARKKPAKRRQVVDDPNQLVDAERSQIKIKIPGEKVEDNEVSEGRRWIMVTGLLPVEKQLTSFEETFRTAAGFEQKNDLPLYFGYEVERADVTGGASPVWKPYDKVSSRSLLIAMLRWNRAKQSEIIDLRYKHPIFTCPLPPRVLELWTSKDKHSRIPLKHTGDKKEEKAPELLGERGGEFGGGVVEDVDQLLAGARRTDSRGQEVQSIPYKMVRYFDFDLEPGHAYQYRFRAVLRDPNYIRKPIEGGGLRRVEIKLLEQPVITRLSQKRQALVKAGYKPELVERLMQITYTAWSDPSPAVKVPPTTYVLAVGAQPAPARKYNEEPSATIMITEYDQTLGVETGGQTTLQRGSLAKFSEDRVRVINVDYSTFDFRRQSFDPNRMLVDVQGGEALGDSSLTAPGELLMMDFSKGKLIVNKEMEDAKSVREYELRQRELDRLIPTVKKPTGGDTGPLGIDVFN